MSNPIKSLLPTPLSMHFISDMNALAKLPLPLYKFFISKTNYKLFRLWISIKIHPNQYQWWMHPDSYFKNLKHQQITWRWSDQCCQITWKHCKKVILFKNIKSAKVDENILTWLSIRQSIKLSKIYCHCTDREHFNWRIKTHLFVRKVIILCSRELKISTFQDRNKIRSCRMVNLQLEEN